MSGVRGRGGIIWCQACGRRYAQPSGTLCAHCDHRPKAQVASTTSTARHVWYHDGRTARVFEVVWDGSIR